MRVHSFARFGEWHGYRLDFPRARCGARKRKKEECVPLCGRRALLERARVENGGQERLDACALRPGRIRQADRTRNLESENLM